MALLVFAIICLCIGMNRRSKKVRERAEQKKMIDELLREVRNEKKSEEVVKTSGKTINDLYK